MLGNAAHNRNFFFPAALQWLWKGDLISPICEYGCILPLVWQFLHQKIRCNTSGLLLQFLVAAAQFYSCSSMFFFQNMLKEGWNHCKNWSGRIVRISEEGHLITLYSHTGACQLYRLKSQNLDFSDRKMHDSCIELFFKGGVSWEAATKSWEFLHDLLSPVTTDCAVFLCCALTWIPVCWGLCWEHKLVLEQQLWHCNGRQARLTCAVF